MKALPHTHSCFVCGESNATGLKLRFETDGHVVRTHFKPTPSHIGFKEVIHGGILSTVLDEIMVWACAVQTKRFAYCAELTVRFAHPVRPGEELAVTAEMTANRRNRLFEAKSEMRNPEGKIVATATGKYLPINAADEAAMATDFVQDPRTNSVG
jgi:uncharacterized protein (TIGR00369 family)